MKKLLIGIVATVGLLAPQTAFSYNWKPTHITCTETSPSVNVRSGPGLNYRVLYTIPAWAFDYPIQILERRGNWSRILFRGNRSNSYHWVHSDFLCRYQW